MADDYKPIEKGKSQLIKLRANLRSFDYSEVGDYDKKGTPAKTSIPSFTANPDLGQISPT